MYFGYDSWQKNTYLPFFLKRNSIISLGTWRSNNLVISTLEAQKDTILDEETERILHYVLCLSFDIHSSSKFLS